MTSPFLKWPGGKRWLAKNLAEAIRPHLHGTYYEPFLGSGALFFALQPARAVLSDINAELINVYIQVQKAHRELIKRIGALPVSERTFAIVRARRSRGAIQRAADFLYLNRTAWGGIYRVNSAGKFNAPYGGGERTPAILWERELLSHAAVALGGATLEAVDFESQLDAARRGDVVYCDPTYTVAHDRNGFVRYNELNFSWQDQMRLASASSRAAKRGAVVFVSNAHHASLLKLYPSARVKVLTRKSLVSSDVKMRRDVKEYLLELRGS